MINYVSEWISPFRHQERKKHFYGYISVAKRETPSLNMHTHIQTSTTLAIFQKPSQHAGTVSPVFPFQRGGLSPPSSSWGRASGLILLKNSVTDVLEILFTQCSLSHVTMSTDMYQSAKSSQCVCVCVWDLQWDVKRPVEASVSSQHASLYGSWTQWWLCTKKHNSSVLNEFQVEYRWTKFLLERRAIPDQHGPYSRSL